MPSIHTRYDSFIKTHPHEMKTALQEMDGQLIANGCMFGDGAIPCFLKPYFLSVRDTSELRRILLHVTSMLEKIIRAYFDYPELKPIFGLSKDIHEYVSIDPGYKHTVAVARPDAFFDGKRFTFIEFNCDSPAGAGWSDTAEELFYDTFAMRKVSKFYKWVPSKRTDALLEALLECYRDFGGRHSHPHFAIVDWHDVKTRHEFLIIKKRFEEKGYPCIVADPRDLKFKNGKLMAGGFRVDVIYRRVIFNELWEKKDEVKDFLKAYRMSKVCVVNPFRSRLAANKAILTILTNPMYDGLFTKAEIKVRNENIAWTRRLIEAGKIYRKKRKPLIPTVEKEKEVFVIKPADSYGGKGVAIGFETPQTQWNKLVKHAVGGNGRWVVQEVVKIPQMRVPLYQNGKVRLAEKKVNINPFVFNGRYAGAVARLSDQSVINVSAGGGLVPVVTYKENVTKRKR